MWTVLMCFAMSVLLYVQVVHAGTFTYRWEMDETPEGVERANMNKPVQVLLMDAVVETAPHSAALQLKQKIFGTSQYRVECCRSIPAAANF